MKSLMTTAIILAFTLMSCKKEAATENQSQIDTVSSANTFSSNSGELTSDTMTTVQEGAKSSDSVMPATADSTTSRQR